jgi:spermidine synthase
MQRLNWAVLLSGFVAVVGQTLLIREALSLFGGNELVSGILLSLWLLWGGIGSLAFSWLGPKKEPVRVYAVLLLLLSLFLMLSLCFIRIAPRIFALPFGEVIDFGKIILISVLTLAPTCMVFGALFPAASRILQPERVYLIEGLGAFMGGVIVSFILIPILPPFGIMLLCIVSLMCMALLIEKRIMFSLIPFLLLILFVKIDTLELFFRRVQMAGQELVDLRESRYGVIAVTESQGQYNFYTNGLYDFSYPDVYSSEEAVHYALLLHATPKKVLLIGGGIGSSIRQILKHASIQRVTYVELDPLLFSMGKNYVGDDLSREEKLAVVFGDARYYVKRTHENYDVVIVNLPEPANAQINRFYTQEFFAEVKRILAPGGLLSVRITAPPDIISPLFGQLLNTIYRSLGLSFRSVIALPVAKTTFIATDRPMALDSIVEILKARITERNLELNYVNQYYFDYNLSQEKLQYLNNRIAESHGYINGDLKPVCYYFTSILWGGILAHNLRKAFVSVFGLPPAFFLLPLIIVLFFYRRRSLIYVSVLAVGASEISAEVVLIVLFQVFYGYVYGWIGAIIACYMLGLAMGTLCYMRLPFLKRNRIRNLAGLQFCLTIYFVLMIAVALTQPPLVNVVIAVLVFVGGLLGGVHFPLSVAIISRQKAGYVYGIDLVGSSLGALVTAMVLIPVLGIVFTLLVFGLLNCLVGFGLNTIRAD